jgi:sortase (surface protein transpeptidase)
MQNPDGARTWPGTTASLGRVRRQRRLLRPPGLPRLRPAVFARLAEVKGDIVEVRLEDGTLHRYAVSVSVLYPADSAPSQEIVGPTGREMVTLVTCGGTWQGRPRGYSHRLVVRADHL